MTNNKLNIKATGVISMAVMSSRLLGLIREILFNDLFGAASMGIFLIAFRAPNLLRDLFAEGVLSISFITIFSKKLESEGENSAWQLASKMMTLLSVFMSISSLLGIIYAEKMITILAPGFSTEDANATILLTQIMYPFIFLVSLAALAMGILNSKNVFGIPALASSFFNMGSIIGGTLCGWLIDPSFGKKALIGLAIGTTLGGLLQLAVQIPSLRRVGFHFKPDFRWNDAGVRSILILTVPGIIAASAVQINVLISSSFSSYIGAEAVTWLNSAFRLVQFPIGIFGVAVATITLPVISRIAATKDHSQFGVTLGQAMRFVVFLTMPAAVGFWIFSKPIISLIYEHGKFYATDSTQTAFALQFYALGLVAYSCIKVLSPGFYAIEKKWTPMFVSFASIFINIALNCFFIFVLKMGHQGLALSTAISAIANFLALYFLMAHAHNLQTIKFINNFIRCGIASIALALICWIALIYFPNFIYSQSFSTRICSLFAAIFFASLIYISTCLILKVEGAHYIFKIALQKTRYKKLAFANNSSDA
ncbi:MAG: murein biosynthesis integral membrane protein MurJ [Gammaproteobacteria bacterium]